MVLAVGRGSAPPPPRHSCGSAPQMKTSFSAFFYWLKNETQSACGVGISLHVKSINKPVLTAFTGEVRTDLISSPSLLNRK